MNDRNAGVDSMVLTSTNKDKSELNEEIRRRLEKTGAVESGKSYEIHRKSDLDAVTRNYADSYREGQKVVFTREAGDIKRGTQGEIIGRNTENNILQIKLWDKESAAYKESVSRLQEAIGKAAGVRRGGEESSGRGQDNISEER